MTTLSRRSLLKLTGSTAAVGALAISSRSLAQTPEHQAPAGSTTLPYPNNIIAKMSELKVNEPLSFLYPDDASPCVLIKKGKEVLAGAGPDKDIVAYSILCTHMGCPVTYDAATETFKCPCHFSIFDPDKGGQMVCGQATENLPRIILDYSGSDGSIKAVAVDGLIYGRQSNIL
ncbi:arsenate reductase (azurin) small subunit [Pseudomonas fluorescens]|uniref:Arsenate reductase (Azurin) small subunit n=1 Tax=Pseudomonas fluorescens TaxID=294 RepID=A0A944HCJ0_PSEFL|nr:arsenate reductase (azurin) small subunit [Pseudomonas fluorescens]MBT2297608.1 arsenate reductase (azurin) small subunit [Pseudomonas fluorescens]MBT2305806.1 arsenate reductase (azurin) small subunit [Pseudomonas fluorescens]MBT2314171.1 arsenate reductase (azurin) small subunit [Pseudomonas fluorescens]MBT2319337.1 arsenate reductase (azurin) small subunit [Pseudomonas fluorescens]MBT2329246.1 arsenate reductase (azurin) small subunit [Pseudomonas fluorescens]